MDLQCEQKTICYAGCLDNKCLKTGKLRAVMDKKLKWSSRFIGTFCAYVGFSVCFVFLVYNQNQNRLESYRFIKNVRPGSEVSLNYIMESVGDDSVFSERDSQVGHRSFYSDL